MNGFIKKIGVKTVLLFLIGFSFIFIGLGIHLKSGKTIMINKSAKLATGDSFSIELSSEDNSIALGEDVVVNVKAQDINISGGDKGIGVLEFILNYDKSIFSNPEIISTVGKATINPDNNHVVFIVDNGQTIKSDSILFNIKFHSKASNEKSSIVSMTNINASSGQVVASQNAQVELVFSQPQVDTNISFIQNGTNIYKKQHTIGVNINGTNLDLNSLNYKLISSATGEVIQTARLGSSAQLTTPDNLTGRYYYSIHAESGGVITEKTSSYIYLDNTKPTCEIQRNGNVVKVIGSDAHSGLAQLPYSFNNENYSDVDTKTLDGSGEITVNAHVKDKAGNISDCSRTFEITDNSKPTINVTPSQSTPTKSKNITISVNGGGTSELATDNTYQYFLSESMLPVAADNLNNYSSEIEFNIGADKTGIFYLFVRSIKNQAGNESSENGEKVTIDGVNYQRFGPYIFDNEKPSCKVEKSTTSSAKSVILKLTSNDNTSTEMSYSFDGITFGTTKTLNVTENGTYNFYIKDQVGNIVTCDPVIVNNIDKTGPSVVFENNGSPNYAKEVSTVVRVADNLELDDNSLKYQWTNSLSKPTVNSFTTTFVNNDKITKKYVSGEWYLWIIARDKAGNEVITRSEKFLLDNEEPTVPKITGNCESNVQIGMNAILKIDSSTSLSGIEKYQYSLNNGITWIDYNNSTGIVITEPGQTSVIAKAISNVGITSKKSTEFIVSIKHTPMNLVYKTSALAPTNKNVMITIRANNKLKAPIGWQVSSSDPYLIYKEYTENITEKVTVEDIHGNSEEVTVVVSEIDRVTPKLDITYNKHQNYVETVIKSDEKLLSLDGWNLADDEKSISKIYYHNTNESVSFSDLAGNEIEKSISINSIDEGDFSINVSYIEQSDGSVIVNITSDEELKKISGWTVSSDKKTLKRKYTNNFSNSVTVIAADNSKKNINIAYVFKSEVLEIKEVHSTTDMTNQSVIVTLSSNYEIQKIDGWELSLDKMGLTKVFNENTEEVVNIISTDGKTITKTIKINNIDKVVPTILNCKNNGVYDSLKLIFSENLSSVKITKDKENIAYTLGNDVTLSDEGNYIITLKDTSSNVSIYNITIKKSKQNVLVPDTSSRFSKMFIVLGFFEIIVGILLCFNVRFNKQINLLIVLCCLVMTKFVSSMATTQTGFELNGYILKNGYLYNIEATTTYNDLKQNLDDDKSVLVKRNDSEISSTTKISTGDLLRYKNTDYKVVISGDIDKNGLVDDTDTSKLVNHIIGSRILSEPIVTAATDYNQSDNIDISDLYRLNKRVVKGYTIPVKNIIATGPTSIKVGESYQIKTKFYPSNASNKQLNYFFSHGSAYSTVSSTGLIKGTQVGESYLVVQSANTGITSFLTYSIIGASKIHVVPISSGDAMLLESNGHYGMIDTGTAAAYTKSSGQHQGTKIKKLLDSVGVEKLDFLIVTHNHEDHIGSAADIINDYKPTTLYIKRYSHQDKVSSSDTDNLDIREQTYQNVISQANKVGTTIKVIGTPSSSKYTTSAELETPFSQSTDRIISLGDFKIKFYNLNNALAKYPCTNFTANENINSLTQVVSINVNGKEMVTYLEADLEERPECLKNGRQIKDVVRDQVVRDYGKVDVYKVGHHAKYNGTNIDELNALNPDYIFATTTQCGLLGKTQSNKLHSIEAVQTYLNTSSKFNNNFKLSGYSDKPIVIDFSSGKIQFTGGVSWNTDIDNYYNNNCN